MVLSGEALAQIPVAGGTRTVARLGPGQRCGEIAVLCDRPRSAAIVAVGETEILRLAADDLRAPVAEFAELSSELRRSLAERLETTSRQLAQARAEARRSM